MLMKGLNLSNISIEYELPNDNQSISEKLNNLDEENKLLYY